MRRYVSSKESVQKSSNIKTAAAADWKFNNLDAINILPGKISIALPAWRTRTVSRMLQKIARKLTEATFECDHSSMSSDLTGPCLMSTAARSDLWGHSRVKRSTSSRYISENKHQYTWKSRVLCLRKYPLFFQFRFISRSCMIGYILYQKKVINTI